MNGLVCNEVTNYRYYFTDAKMILETGCINKFKSNVFYLLWRKVDVAWCFLRLFMSQNDSGVNGVLNLTHHTKGEGVTGFRHGQTLDHLRSHPRKRAHQGHVCCVRQELRCPKITDLRRQKQNRVKWLSPNTHKRFAGAKSPNHLSWGFTEASPSRHDHPGEAVSGFLSCSVSHCPLVFTHCS